MIKSATSAGVALVVSTVKDSSPLGVISGARDCVCASAQIHIGFHIQTGKAPYLLGRGSDSGGYMMC